MLIKTNWSMKNRAAEGIRTLDLVLTKDALYRLSYSSLWRAVTPDFAREPSPEEFRPGMASLTADRFFS